MLAILILLAGIVARIITHDANFTPFLALILFGGVYLNRKLALLLPVALMMITDVLLGVHNIILFTWGSILIVAFIGLALRKRKTPVMIFGASLLSAVIFFLTTNFGVWLMGWYPHTLAGLQECFILALPFFRKTLISTVFYSTVFFGIYEIIAYRIKDTQMARVLLTA